MTDYRLHDRCPELLGNGKSEMGIGGVGSRKWLTGQALRTESVRRYTAHFRFPISHFRAVRYHPSRITRCTFSGGIT